MSAEHLLAEIAPILHVLTDPAGGDVNEATKSLHQLVIADSAKTLLLLAQIGAQGVGGFQSDARMIALISLNRLMFKTLDGLYHNPKEKVNSTPWYAVPEAMRVRIEDALCHGLKDEMDMKVRKSIALCAARWAEESHGRNLRPFKQLPSVVISLTMSTQTWHRFTAFQILANCPLLFFMCGADDCMSSRELANTIMGGMTDTSVDTKIEALKAMSKMMLHNGDVMRAETNRRDWLIHQAILCVDTLPWAIRDTGLEPLVELANERPSLFLSGLEHYVIYLLSLMSPDPIDMYEFTTVKRDDQYDRSNWQDVGTQSSELLIALIDGYPSEFLKPERTDILKDIIGSYIGAQISAFDRQDDSQLWSNTDPDDEEDYPEYPEEALTRLGQILPSAHFLQLAVGHARGLLVNKDWRAKYCATMAMACITPGCYQFVDLRLLLTGMDQCRTDDNPRVRYAWLELVYQLAQSPDGQMQRMCLDYTVKLVRGVLRDPSPRVRAQAARCLAGILSPIYSQFASSLKDREELVDQLFSTFEFGPIYVQIEVLKALSTLAELLGPQCKAMYKPWMGKLLSILCPGGTPETRVWAIENATLLVAAVGPKMAASDLAQLAPIMLHYHNGIDETSEEWPILLFGWERLAAALEEGFAPMLPMIIPRILKTASIPPDEDSDPYHCSDECKSKASGLTALWFYASNVSNGFVQYLQPVWQLVLDSLDLRFPCEVKKAAFNLLPLLLHQIKHSQNVAPDFVASAWGDIMKVFVPIMKEEPEFPATTACFVALREVTRVLYCSPPIESASTIFMYANLRIDEVRGLREQRIEDNAEYPDEPFDHSDVEAEEEELLLDIERATRTLAEFMKGTLEVQQAYRTIRAVIGTMVDHVDGQ